MKNLSDLTGIYEGRKVWVLGNGPSLDSIDLSTIPRDRCIGVNRILRPGGRNENILRSGWAPGYIVFQDLQVWTGIKGKDAEGPRMTKSGSTLIVVWHLYKHLIEELPLFRCITFETEKKPASKALDGLLCDCHLTGTIAAQIAARMVYPGGTVVLCGMDLEYPKDRNVKDHSYGSGRRLGCNIDKAKEAAQFLAKLRDGLRGNVEFTIIGNSLLTTKKIRFSS